MRRYSRKTQKGRILVKMLDGRFHSVYDFPQDLSYTLRNRIAEMAKDGVRFDKEDRRVGKRTVKAYRLATWPAPVAD